jgi:KRAB domain-containing zinc finger protein
VINVNITGKRKDFLKQHEKKHLPAHAVQWYSCDKCSFKTKDKTYIEEHRTIHLSADAIKWYSCDKCQFKTKYKTYLKKHKTIHLSGDTIQTQRKKYLRIHQNRKQHHSANPLYWFSCDKCEYRTQRNDYLKLHKKSHFSVETIQ